MVSDDELMEVSLSTEKGYSSELCTKSCTIATDESDEEMANEEASNTKYHNERPSASCCTKDAIAFNDSNEEQETNETFLNKEETRGANEEEIKNSSDSCFASHSLTERSKKEGKEVTLLSKEQEEDVCNEGKNGLFVNKCAVKTMMYHVP